MRPGHDRAALERCVLRFELRSALLPLFVAFACACEIGGNERTAGVPAFLGVIVDSIPFIDLAGTAPDSSVLFEWVNAATRLSSGVIALADLDGVRYIDPVGQTVRTLTRRGSGPGEMQAVSWVGRCSRDSVFARDRNQQRMVVLDSAGRVSRQYRVSGAIGAITCSRGGVVAGLFMPANMRIPRTRGEPVRYRSSIALMNSAGGTVASIGDIPYGDLLPLGKATQIAITDEFLYIGTSDSAFVDKYRLDGILAAALPIGVPGRSPTQHHQTAVIEAAIARFRDSETRESNRARLRDLPLPVELRPYNGLFTDPRGNLWAVTSSPGDAATELMAIDPDGKHVASVRIPRELTVFEIGEDYLLGAYLAEDGEQHLVLYHLRRT